MGSIAIQVRADDTNYPLNVTINKSGFGGVTGLIGANAPTVAIRDGSTIDRYLDFGDLPNFKVGGWVTKYAPLTEVERGHYTRFLDISSLSLSIGDILIAEYHVDDGVDIVGDNHDILVIADTLSNNIGRVKQGYTFDQATSNLIVNTSLEDSDGLVSTGVTNGTLNFYDSNGTLIAGPIVDPTPDLNGVFRFTFTVPILAIGENAFYSRASIDTTAPVDTVIGITKITLVRTS